MSFDYQNLKITDYNDFVDIVQSIGFLPFSENCIGLTSLSSVTSDEQWHTDLPSDPWKWRVKIEDEHKAAYGKFFDKKPGFISIEWLPAFLAARRMERSFFQMYADGLMSEYSKKIYALFEKNEVLAVHEIKALCGTTKETNSKFESALTELQMNMFITCSGIKYKVNAKGEIYGWPSAAYSTIEEWAGSEIMHKASDIKPKEAEKMILDRITDMCPKAQLSKIKKFSGVGL